MSLALVVVLAPGCTLLDEILPGTPFTPDQPVAEVTVVGKINIDRVSRTTEGCNAGNAMLWGTARNTGDMDVVDVFIEIDALDANNNVLGTFRVNVFNGKISEVLPPPVTTPTTPTTPPATTPPATTEPPEESVQIAGTSLAVDETGTFEVCAPLNAGSVAGTAYRTSFIVLEKLL